MGFIFGPLVHFGFGCLLCVTELVFFQSEMAGKRKRNASSQKLKEDVNRGELCGDKESHTIKVQVS